MKLRVSLNETYIMKLKVSFNETTTSSMLKR